MRRMPTWMSLPASWPVKSINAYSLREIFDLRFLECQLLQLILDALRLAGFDLDLLHVDGLFLQGGCHPFLFTRHQEQESLP